MSPELRISLAILFLPLVSFIILIFFGKRFPEKSGRVGTTFLGIDLILAFYIFFSKLSSESHWDFTFTWIDFHTVVNHVPLKIDIGIMVDNLSAGMLLVAIAGVPVMARRERTVEKKFRGKIK